MAEESVTLKEHILSRLKSLEKELDRIREEIDIKLQALEKGKRDNIALIIALLGLMIAIAGIFLKSN